MKSASLGYALSLLENIKLDWKRLVGKKQSCLLEPFVSYEENKCVYRPRSINYEEKSYVTLKPGANVIKLLLSVIYGFSY